MTRRRIFFKNPDDYAFYVTPEFNGDKAEFEILRGSSDGSGDGCAKDFADILRDHFAGVMTLNEFKTASQYAQQEYRSCLGAPEILPVEKILDISSLAADEVYILTPQKWKLDYLDYLNGNPENAKSWKEYCRFILNECVRMGGNIKFSNVYFRINAGYVYDEGLPEEKKQPFYDEVLTLFESAGWIIEPSQKSCISPTARKGKQSLYLHPMQFSGACLNCEIEMIEKTLRLGKTFSLRGVDIYKEVFDTTDEAFLESLNAQKAAITDNILTAFKTKRRNLYIVDYSTALRSVWRKYDIDRLGRTGYDNEKILSPFAQSIFDELVKKGRIVSCETRMGLGYRTDLSKKAN